MCGFHERCQFWRNLRDFTGRRNETLIEIVPSLFISYLGVGIRGQKEAVTFEGVAIESSLQPAQSVKRTSKRCDMFILLLGGVHIHQCRCAGRGANGCDDGKGSRRFLRHRKFVQHVRKVPKRDVVEVRSD